MFGERESVTFRKDFPIWKRKEQEQEHIKITVELQLDAVADSGLFKFLDTLSIKPDVAQIHISICSTYKHDSPAPSITMRVDGTEIESTKATEVLEKLQGARPFLLYNSTELDDRYGFRHQYQGVVGDFSSEDKETIDKLRERISKTFAQLAKKYQADLKDVLGRLEDKYQVSLKPPNLDPTYAPFEVSLADKNVDASLFDWGSGTRNRTLILLTLFRARRMSIAATAKITPVLLIEEPESFLHPAAQAEFGRVLQDLSEEFQVQVIVCTHSPYMLSQSQPSANVLLVRDAKGSANPCTRVVDTHGEGWMEPFGLALGLDNAEFTPWKNLFFGRGDSILLVEGEIDKEYFEYFRDETHGTNKMQYVGEIVPYDGAGSLSNSILLKFVKNRYRRIFVTYDLDVESQVEKTLKGLSLVKGKDYTAIGIDSAGKRDIEGLVPDRVRSAVYSENPNFVAALGGSSEERRDAKRKIKRLLLAELKKPVDDGLSDCKLFYPLVRAVDKALGYK